MGCHTLLLYDGRVARADAGPADLHDDVERPADRGLGHVVDDRLGVEFMQTDGLHGSSSTCFAVYLCPWFRRVPASVLSQGSAGPLLGVEPPSRSGSGRRVVACIRAGAGG